MGNDMIFCLMLELSAVLPAAILCYLPMKGHLEIGRASCRERVWYLV